MKKIILLLMLMLIPTKILALGNISVDNTNIEIVKGETKTFNITLTNAAGRLNIISSNKEIVGLDKESIFLDQDTGTITITGVNSGTTTINVEAYDVSTYDMETLNDNIYTINVSVIDPYLKGDINNNGKIGLEDINTLLKKYIGIEDITDKDIRIGDMNNNHKIDLNDIILLLKTYLGIN